MIWSSLRRKSKRFYFSPKCPDFYVLIFMISACTITLEWTKLSFHIQWKLNFVFLEFSAHFCHSHQNFDKNISLKYMFVHSYAQIEHKRSCWYCIKYFWLEMRKEKLIFIYIFLSSCMLTVKLIQDFASTVESCFLQMPRLCRDEWCLMHVLIDHYLYLLIKLLY